MLTVARADTDFDERIRAGADIFNVSAAAETPAVVRRIREGALALGDLPVGAWRYLTAEEAEKLKKV